jgi:hypothetical protein
MAFIVKQTDTYHWPVTVELPTDGGRYEKHTFEAEFKRLPQSRVEQIISGGDNAPTDDRALVSEIMIGWKGVTDGTDDLVWSETNRDMVLEIPKLAVSIIQAWTESLAGGRRKN